MVRIGLLLATMLAAAALPTATAQSSSSSSLTCPAVPANTLTFSCGSVCSSGRPCVNTVIPSAAIGDDTCKCLNITAKASDDTTTRLRLLIPFATYKSEEEKAAQATPSEILTGTVDTKTYAFAGNDVLNRVDKLTLPSSIAGVVIRGGSSMEALTKHKVANVTFDPQFLVLASKQVTYVELENLAIGDAIEVLIGNLPQATVQLQLRNDLIKKFPTKLDTLSSLKYLHLSFNDIETMSKSDKLNDLVSLYLRNNKIKTFETFFPKLENLDLSYNYLDGVPEVIMKHTNLKKLYLGGSANTILKFDESHAIRGLEELALYDLNLETFDATLPNLVALSLTDNNLKAIPPKVFKMPKLETLFMTYNKKMLNVTVTNVQANFIYNLKKFTIDNTSLQTNCSATHKYTFAKLNVTMCLSEPTNVAVIEGPRVIPADAAPASGSGAGNANVETPTDKSSSSKLPVIIGSIAGVLVVAGIVAAFVIKRRKDKRTKAADALTGMTGTVSGMTMTGTNGTSLWVDADLLSLKVSVDDIEDVKKIGNGAFADVWLVKFRGAEVLASKRLRESGVSRPQIQNFIDEIKLVASLKHPCVVELKGVAWVRESDLQALFEFMDSGDLRDHLLNPQVAVKWSAEKLQIAIDVADALVYVHSFMPPLVHRDLKSRNVLLNSGEATLRAKLTDFGVSRYKSEDNTMTSGVGTGKWLAPEVISGDGDYGPAADIFSFGALLFELDTHKLPYDDVRGPNGNRLADVALLQLVASGQLTPTMSASCPTEIAELASRCFALLPTDRPTAAEIAYALRTAKKSLQF